MYQMPEEVFTASVKLFKKSRNKLPYFPLRMAMSQLHRKTLSRSGGRGQGTPVQMLLSSSVLDQAGANM